MIGFTEREPAMFAASHRSGTAGLPDFGSSTTGGRSVPASAWIYWAALDSNQRLPPGEDGLRGVR
jgi:hypothetical protein